LLRSPAAPERGDVGVSGLSVAEIAERLGPMPGWRHVGNALARTWRFRDFREAMFFVNGVAALAERAEHHPDVGVHYNEVTLSLWSHSAGGVTERDFALAREIDAFFPASPAR
jgi:4a-hydroxytetrahydrobiopterin dehydratase